MVKKGYLGKRYNLCVTRLKIVDRITTIEQSGRYFSGSIRVLVQLDSLKTTIVFYMKQINLMLIDCSFQTLNGSLQEIRFKILVDQDLNSVIFIRSGVSGV